VDNVARAIVILGEDEVKSGVVTVKTFVSGEQVKVVRSGLAEALRG
jgi:histidyl-tRNA synthetase